MALNPVVIKTAVSVTWDGVTRRIDPGTTLDSPAPAGSNLLQTIGAANFAALQAAQLAGSPGVLDDGVRNSNLRSGQAYNSGQN